MTSIALLFPLLICVGQVSATRKCMATLVSSGMNCSRLKLEHLPEVIPPKTKWLDASYNKIKNVSFTESLEVLEYLDLSHNDISKLEDGSLTKLPSLKVLNLTHNKLLLELSSYPVHVFSSVPLHILHLHHNDNNTPRYGKYPNSLASLTQLYELTIDTFTYISFNNSFPAMVNLRKLLLGFEYCKVTELTNETFLPLANISVEVLSLNHCPLKTIEKDAFAPLKNLRKLHVSHTKYLDPYIAITSMYGLRTQLLDVLHLDKLMDFNIFKTTNLRKFILSKEITTHIKNVCVAKLSLKHNQLLWIEFIDWSKSRFSRCIRHLDLSGNDMYGNMKYMFTLSLFPHLEYLNLSRHFVLKAEHHHFDLNDLQYPHQSSYYSPSNIESHLLQHKKSGWSVKGDRTKSRNQSDLISPDQSEDHSQVLVSNQSGEVHVYRKPPGNSTIGITTPKSLRVADFNGFSVNQLDLDSDLFFYNAVSLKKFRFAFNHVTAFKNRIMGLSALKEFDISGNTCGNMTPTFFSELESLEILNMSYASLNIPETYLLENGPRVFKPLRKLKRIDLSSNKLTRMSPRTFAENPLQGIDLSNNRFITIPFDLTTTPSLEYLDLSINMFSVFEQHEMEALDHLGFTNGLTINLKGNILTCDCDNLDFIVWLFNTYANIEDLETHSLTCIREDATYSTVDNTYKDLMKVWRRCNGRIWLCLSGTLFSGFCLSLAFAYIICWRKTLILNSLLRMFGFSNIISQQERKDFRFDVFLGNSEQDDEFVLQAVSIHLESKHKLDVYISVRDMIPGSSIPQAIVSAVDSSWKIVLVITRAFLEDNWCRFITDYAIYVSTFRPPGSVLLLLFDDVNIGDISPSLLNVVDEDLVFSLKEDSLAELDTWTRVGQAVKKK